MKTFSEVMQELSDEQNGIANPYDRLYKSGEDRSRFPESLLDNDKEERLAYFDRKLILHARLQSMTEEILRFITNPTRPIVLVIGPSNIGKTTLLYKVNRNFLKQRISQLVENRGIVPIGWGEALNSHRRIYQWNVFYQMGYEMLNEGLSGKNILIGPDKYKRGFIGALKNRHTDVFQIDEGHNFIYISDTRGQMEELKTISNLSNTTIVIYGTYDLLQFLDLNSQLLLRTERFHFQRYLPDEKDVKDFANFVNIIGNFQRFLPLRKAPDFLGRPEYFYLHTAGCTGILKRWLMSCLSDAIENNDVTIDDKCLKKHELSSDVLLRLIREINDGEEYFLRMNQWSDKMEESVKANLGMLPNKEAKPGNKTVTDKTAPSKKRTGVGKRNPKRDPITPQHN